MKRERETEEESICRCVGEKKGRVIYLSFCDPVGQSVGAPRQVADKSCVSEN